MQTMELLRGLGFTMYADLSGAVSLQEHPRLIFQIESLPRVFSSDMEPFDAVYADEIAQSIGSTFALRVCVYVCVCVLTDAKPCVCVQRMFSPSDQSRSRKQSFVVWL